MNASNHCLRSRPFERDSMMVHGNCRALLLVYGDIVPLMCAGAAHSAECFVYVACCSPSPISGMTVEGEAGEVDS